MKDSLKGYELKLELGDEKELNKLRTRYLADRIRRQRQKEAVHGGDKRRRP